MTETVEEETRKSVDVHEGPTTSELNVIKAPDDNEETVSEKEFSIGDEDEEEEILEEEEEILIRDSLYDFPSVRDPGIYQVLEVTSEEKKYIDTLGRDRYHELCKKIQIFKISRFEKALDENTINLKYYGINPCGFRAIATALNYNPNVLHVDIQDNWMMRDGAYYFGEMLKNNSILKSLNLHGCRIGPVNIQFFQEALVITQSLQYLNLASNELGDKGLDALVAGLIYNRCIRTLILSHNNIAGMTDALPTLFDENDSICNLDLSWNVIGDSQACKKMFAALQNNSFVQKLDLSWNALADNAADPLGKLLKNNSCLTVLNLMNNRIGDGSLLKIARGLEHSESLTELYLGENPVTSDGLMKFIKPLAPTTSCVLERLDLKNVMVDKKFAEAAKQVISKRENLEIAYEGILDNFVIKGPDMKKLLLARAKFENGKLRKPINFGHFILALPDETVKGAEFDKRMAGHKLKMADTLVDELKKAFAVGKNQVDCRAMKEYYLKLYPDTTPPAPKPQKEGKEKKKGGKKEGKGGKKGKKK